MIYQCPKCGLSKSNGAMNSILPQCKCDWGTPAAPVQESVNQRAYEMALRQWEHWKQYALELQEKLVKYEGGAPMVLNTTPPAAQRQWVGLTDDAIYAAADIAWRAGWVACRDAEFVGEEAENEAWGYQGATVAQDVKAMLREKNT